MHNLLLAFAPADHLMTLCNRGLLLSLILLASPLPLPGQTERQPATPAVKTLVEFEILLPRQGDALDAQKWGPTFERIGVSVRFRQAILDDEPEVEERMRGTWRMVNVVGEMDREGTLHFPEKSFTMSEGAKLADWVEELKTFGAQGSPDGKPVWGLSEAQFTAVYDELSKPIENSLEGQELPDALQNLQLPADYPVRLHETAENRLTDPSSAHALREEVQGLSLGTGLAIVLADYGLGFRPIRNTKGTIALVVEPLSEITDPWPIGWELDPAQPRNEVAPGYFEMVRAGFDDLPLEDVLDAVEQASGTPIIINYEGSAARGIDPAVVRVSYPQKQTAWVLIVRTVTSQARLTREIMIDEAGKPFIYVFPFVPQRAAD